MLKRNFAFDICFGKCPTRPLPMGARSGPRWRVDLWCWFQTSENKDQAQNYQRFKQLDVRYLTWRKSMLKQNPVHVFWEVYQHRPLPMGARPGPR